MRLSVSGPAFAIAAFLMAGATAFAQETSTDSLARELMSRQSAQFLSNDGSLLFLGAGTLYPLTRHGINDIQDQNRSLRIVDTAITATAITEILKHVVRSQRPDGSTRDSFPSGHATAAFAVADMAARYDRSSAPFWYAGATLISISRVRLNRHRWTDIAAGALIGMVTGELERRQPRGLLLAPIFGSELTRHEAGSPTRSVALSLTF